MYFVSLTHTWILVLNISVKPELRKKTWRQTEFLFSYIQLIWLILCLPTGERAARGTKLYTNAMRSNIGTGFTTGQRIILSGSLPKYNAITNHHITSRYRLCSQLVKVMFHYTIELQGQTDKYLAIIRATIIRLRVEVWKTTLWTKCVKWNVIWSTRPISLPWNKDHLDICTHVCPQINYSTSTLADSAIFPRHFSNCLQHNK